jgi:hypothetical protein
MADRAIAHAGVSRSVTRTDERDAASCSSQRRSSRLGVGEGPSMTADRERLTSAPFEQPRSRDRRSAG